MSNYETAKKSGAERFLTYETQKIIDRLGLRSDGDYLYMDFVSRACRIQLSTGLCQHASREGGFEEAGFNESMTLYDLLCHTEEPIRLSGEFVPLESLSTVQNARSYAGEGSFRQLEQALDGREAALAAACEALGGVRQGRGDISYRIPAFGDVSLLISFWRSDEDFPASLRIYCDRDLTRYIYYETIWYLTGYVTEQIRRQMTEGAT